MCRLITGLVRDPVPVVYYWINKNDSRCICVWTGLPSPVKKTLLPKFFLLCLVKTILGFMITVGVILIQVGQWGGLPFQWKQFESTFLSKMLLTNLFSSRCAETRTLRSTDTCSSWCLNLYSTDWWEVEISTRVSVYINEGQNVSEMLDLVPQIAN